MRPHHLSLLLPLLAMPQAGLAQQPFRIARTFALPPITTGYDIAAGDVDGDGDLDLVVGNDHDPNQLFVNDGRGAFTDVTAGRLTTPPPLPGQPFSNATYAVDLADIDGDGDLDLLLCNDHNLPDRVHVNNGAGVFTDVSATALPPNADWSVDQVVADLDGDGDVDWFVQHSTHARLYLNNGAGVFTDATVTNLPAAPGVALGSLDHTGCSAVDLDLDGDLDLLVPTAPNGSSGPPVILVNQGNAVFTAAPTGTIPAQYTGTTYAADLDGDGRPDLVTGDGRYALPNLGGLTFGAAMTLPFQSRVAFDYDEDGDLDLAGFNVVARNDGPAGFQPFANPGLPIYPGQHCTADLDGDRDLDIATPGRIAANFLRQVEATGAPIRGQPFTVGFHAPAGPFTLCLAAAATTGATVPVPGLGTLRLDPVTSGMLPLLFPGNGLAQLTWTIPNAPGLVGLALHYQALVVDPLRLPVLGNAIRETVQ